jgi:cytochrome c oxidase subunit 3
MSDTVPAAHFVDLRQQREASELGMWVFLSTEVLFFGGLFLLYTAYRNADPAAFAEAGRHTKIVIGTINTAVLLTSSFAVAWAVAAVRLGERRLVVILLGAAAFLGLVFLGLKAFEYLDEYREHLVPGLDFAFAGRHAGGVELFFMFYFVATALHAVHLTIGIVALLVMAWRSNRGDFTPDYHNPLTVTGLYWHFVDVVWIFLFALIYLPGRSGP